jgi:hypothetical protein
MVTSRRLRRRAHKFAATALATGIVVGLGASAALAAPTPGQGPSSSATPYLTPVSPGVQVQSVLTVGDTVPETGNPSGGSYQMIGIPDGLGQFDNGDGTYTLVMDHELGNAVGAVRDHGTVGAFVSKWIIDKATNTVLSGNDLIQTVAPVPGGAAPFNRFCSADLPAVSAFYNASSGLGTQNRIFMNGEESGAEGRAFGHVVTGAAAGTSYYLPALGRFSWENSVANPGSGDKTIVIGTDDSTPGQVYLYVGDKQSTGNDVEKAGLTNGNLLGIKIAGVATEDRTTGVGGSPVPFTLESLGNVSALTGATIQANSAAAGITEFLRPEDAVWEPTNPNVFYFVTTDRLDQVADGTGAQVGRSRLWKATLNSLSNPTGGTLEVLLDGTEGVNMLDNMTADGKGHVIIQEDTGNAAHNAKIWQYDLASDTVKVLLQHDVARFGDLATAPTAPFTQDEESSGVIPAFDTLGEGWFLLDVQAHYGLASPLIEGGQLLAFFNPESVSTPDPVVPEVPIVPVLALSSLAVLGGAVIVMRRRSDAPIVA